MSDVSYEFERFSSREGFNRSLSHFKAVSGMLGEFEHSSNLADSLNLLLEEKNLEQNQLAPIVYALLVDKYGYAFRSYNMEDSLTDFSYIAQETKKWNAVDLVITYFHPDLGLLVINPKNASHWKLVNTLKRNEIVTIYAGAFAQNGDAKAKKLFDEAIDKIVEYLQGKKGTAPARLKSGKLRYREPKPAPPPKRPARQAPQPKGRAARTRAPQRQTLPTQTTSAPTLGPRITASAAARPSAAAAPAAQPAASSSAGAPPAQDSGAKRMTPFYSVPVTNELFHNGNVEAWKKIIQSYTTKYPGLDVYVYYDGERIHDIHALFKWGKVKHGSTILFAVAGENIQDVAKLQRYLRQGASPRFEDFLRFPVNTVLKLF